MQHITLVYWKFGLDLLLKNWDFRVFVKQALSKKLGLLPKFVTHTSPSFKPVYRVGSKAADAKSCLFDRKQPMYSKNESRAVDEP